MVEQGRNLCHFFGMIEKGLKELEESLIKCTTLLQTLRSSSFVERPAAVASLFHNLYRFLKIYVESICDLCPPYHICYEINEWQEFIVSQVLFHKKTGKLFKRLSLGQMLRRFLFSHRILCRKQTFLRSFQLSRPIV